MAFLSNDTIATINCIYVKVLVSPSNSDLSKTVTQSKYEQFRYVPLNIFIKKICNLIQITKCSLEWMMNYSNELTLTKGWKIVLFKQSHNTIWKI